MSQLVNYSIIEAGLRALADKAHESAVAQAEGKPIPCGLSEGDMELVALLTAMMNDTQANKGRCAHEMGKSISSFEKYVHDGKIPEGIHDQFGHEKKWNKSLIRYFANKKAFMMRRVIQLPKYDWSIVCFIGYQPPDANEICHALSDIGCNGNPLSEAYEHLTKESVDRGLTYSSLSERRSVLAIGKCESDGSIINTIGHELLHVVAHICEQDGIDMLSEEPCYMMGSLCEKFFDVSSVNNVN